MPRTYVERAQQDPWTHLGGKRGYVSARSRAMRRVRSRRLAALEEEDGDLAQVEVDEVLRLVSDIRAKVAAHNAVPGRVVLFVELLLDEGGDVLLDVVLFEGLSSAVDSVLPVTQISNWN